jgi:hypothetical protein
MFRKISKYRIITNIKNKNASIIYVICQMMVLVMDIGWASNTIPFMPLVRHSLTASSNEFLLI